MVIECGYNKKNGKGGVLINKSINGDETKTLKVLNGHVSSPRHYPVSSSSHWEDFFGVVVVLRFN